MQKKRGGTAAFLVGAMFVMGAALSLSGMGAARVLSSLVLVCGLLMLAWEDLREGLLPDRLQAPLFVSGLLLSLGGFSEPLPAALSGAILGASILFACRVLSGGGMGLGDVKLGGVLGLWLGWQGVLVALLFAFLLGGLFAGVLLATRRMTREDRIPFGPFLALGAFAALLFGERICAWYGAFLCARGFSPLLL